MKLYVTFARLLWFLISEGVRLFQPITRVAWRLTERQEHSIEELIQRHVRNMAPQPLRALSTEERQWLEETRNQIIKERIDELRRRDGR